VAADTRHRSGQLRGVTYGPAWTPVPRHRPRRRKGTIRLPVRIDLDRLYHLTLTQEHRAFIARLDHHQRAAVRILTIDALSRTRLGYSRAIHLTIDDDRHITIASHWPWAPWQTRPLPPIRWTAPATEETHQ